MNPKSHEARSRDDKPFEGLKISNSDALHSLDMRSTCPSCSKSRMYFCYTCFVPVIPLDGRIPLCRLPIKVDIIKHKREIDGKSTAAHAAVLAPNEVNVYTYPEIPDYDLNGKTVLLYPGTEACTVKDLFTGKINCKTYSENVLAELPPGYNVGTLMTKVFDTELDTNEIFHVAELPIERLILIDSTWNQSRGIFADVRLQRLPKVVLQNRISQFWRHQKGSPRWYLSTVEALHQFLLELHASAWGLSPHYQNELTKHYPRHTQGNHDCCKPYEGEYDNLLYFFKFMYEKLHTLYKHENMLAYKRPMKL